MYSKERIDLCQYRLSKAREYRQDAEKALSLNMYDTAANRSYYAIFHALCWPCQEKISESTPV